MIEPRSDKPLAALSVDLDDLWSYLKTAGDPAWRDYPSFHAIAMPRLFKQLDEFDMGITAFVIGEDVGRPAVQPWLAKFVEQGYELANHSFSHNAALAHTDRRAIEEELQRTELAVETSLGIKLQGYRGPSFSYSESLLSVLAERGYRYDCSTFPTFLGPLARLYHRLAAGAKDSEGAGSDRLFGSWREGFRPLKPYRRQLPGRELLELPNSTMPFLRIPVHGTYLHFLGDISEGLALGYFRLALWLCRVTRTPPVFLLHASDFLGRDDLENSSVIPGMRRSGARKLAFMQRVFQLLTRQYRVVSMRQLVGSLQTASLKTQQPPATP